MSTSKESRARPSRVVSSDVPPCEMQGELVFSVVRPDKSYAEVLRIEDDRLLVRYYDSGNELSGFDFCEDLGECVKGIVEGMA